MVDATAANIGHALALVPRPAIFVGAPFGVGGAHLDDVRVVVRAAGALVVGLAVALPRLFVQPVIRPPIHCGRLGA